MSGKPVFAFALFLFGCASNQVRYDLQKAYYKSGELHEEILVSSRNTKEGKDLAYFKDGKAAKMAYYASDKPSGPEVYLRENGTVRKIIYYSNFRKNGPYLEFDSAGRLETQTTYRNGAKNGLYCVYYPNGQPMYKGSLKSGRPDGPREIYDSLGKPFNGIVDGRYRKGTPRFTGKVVDGKPDSSFTFYADEKVCIKAEFKNGLLQGEHQFISNDHVDSTWYFENGTYVKSVVFKKE